MKLSGVSPAARLAAVYARDGTRFEAMMSNGARIRRGRVIVGPVIEADFEQWLPLWKGYNAFYGRRGKTALAEEITLTTWRRFFDPYEPVHALVAERGAEDPRSSEASWTFRSHLGQGRRPFRPARLPS